MLVHLTVYLHLPLQSAALTNSRVSRRRAIGAAHCAPAPAASTAGRSDSFRVAATGASGMWLCGLMSSALLVVQLRMTCMWQNGPGATLMRQ